MIQEARGLPWQERKCLDRSEPPRSEPWHLPRASLYRVHGKLAKSSTREPSKTKAELREMLTEAVRNTQPRPDHGPGVNEGEAG